MSLTIQENRQRSVFCTEMKYSLHFLYSKDIPILYNYLCPSLAVVMLQKDVRVFIHRIRTSSFRMRSLRRGCKDL